MTEVSLSRRLATPACRRDGGGIAAGPPSTKCCSIPRRRNRAPACAEVLGHADRHGDGLVPERDRRQRCSRRGWRRQPVSPDDASADSARGGGHGHRPGHRGSWNSRGSRDCRVSGRIAFAPNGASRITIEFVDGSVGLHRRDGHADRHRVARDIGAAIRFSPTSNCRWWSASDAPSCSESVVRSRPWFDCRHGSLRRTIPLNCW